MPVTKTYQKFVRDGLLGVVSNDCCRIKYDPLQQDSKGICLVGCSSYCINWDMKSNEMESAFMRPECVEMVTCIDACESWTAVGYTDGWVCIFENENNEIEAKFRASKHRIDFLEIYEDIFICTSVPLCLFSFLNSSKDSLIKFWSVETKHNFLTLTGHSSVVWDMAFNPVKNLLVSGSNDVNLRFWSLDFLNKPSENKMDTLPLNSEPGISVEDINSSRIDHDSLVNADFLGAIKRLSGKRVNQLVFDPRGKEDPVDSDVKLEIDDRFKCAYRIEFNDIINDISMSSMFDQAVESETYLIKMAVHFKNNSIVEYSLENLSITQNSNEMMTLQPKDDFDKKIKDVQLRTLSSVLRPGHRSTPIYCEITEDGLGLLTLSKTEAKLWNKSDLKCLITLNWNEMKSEEVTENLKASCAVLAPGARHLVVGFESGGMGICEFRSKTFVHFENKIHHSALKALSIFDEKKAFVSASTTKEVGIWKFDIMKNKRGNVNLSFVPEMDKFFVAPDEVTTLAATPNGGLICVAMANLKVDIYFRDTFKRAHCLYGHAGAINAMSISADSKQLLTASGDKTVRLWELQFGNCLKRFTSHTAVVTAVCFLPHTRFAFSADLSGSVIQWDVKKHIEVTSLQGHSDMVSSVSGVVLNTAFLSRKQNDDKKKRNNHKKKNKKQPAKDSSDESSEEIEDLSEEDEEDLCGGLIASVSRDWSIRLWSESDELLIVEEEQMLKQERLDNDELARDEINIKGAVPQELCETGAVGKTSEDSVMGAEGIMEALDIYEDYKSALASNAKTPTHPLVQAANAVGNPDKFLLHTIQQLRLSATSGTSLEHVIVLVHTAYVGRLFDCLVHLLRKGWEVELCARALRTMVDVHHHQLMESGHIADLADDIALGRDKQVRELSDIVNFNLAGLTFCRNKIESEQKILLFEEAKEKTELMREKRKRKAVVKV